MKGPFSILAACRRYKPATAEIHISQQRALAAPATCLLLCAYPAVFDPTFLEIVR